MTAVNMNVGTSFTVLVSSGEFWRGVVWRGGSSTGISQLAEREELTEGRQGWRVGSGERLLSASNQQDTVHSTL